MVFFKIVIQETKRNKTKQKKNENSKKTDKNCNLRRIYANKKKKSKNIQGTVSIKSIRS